MRTAALSRADRHGYGRLGVLNAPNRGAMRCKSGAPTSAEACYDPVQEPGARG
jgi:hypothetical protein